jgi:hypothetical protein
MDGCGHPLAAHRRVGKERQSDFVNLHLGNLASSSPPASSSTAPTSPRGRSCGGGISWMFAAAAILDGVEEAAAAAIRGGAEAAGAAIHGGRRGAAAGTGGGSSGGGVGDPLGAETTATVIPWKQGRRR